MVVRWFVAPLIRVRFSYLTPFAPLRKMAKRVDLESTVSEFDSLGEYHGAVAQLAEHRTENPGVGGSIPPRPTIISYY